MKTCKSCGDIKRNSEFSKRKLSPDGLQNECKQCRKALCKEWRAKAENTRNRRKHSYKHKYSISMEEYNEMFIGQRGLCMICENPESTKNRKTGQTQWLAVDHDHETGKVRGLLCGSCNRALGLFKDETENLKRAIKYLKKQRN